MFPEEIDKKKLKRNNLKNINQIYLQLLLSFIISTIRRSGDIRTIRNLLFSKDWRKIIELEISVPKE